MRASSMLKAPYCCHCGEPSAASIAWRSARQSRTSRNQRVTRLRRRRWLLAMTDSAFFNELLVLFRTLRGTSALSLLQNLQACDSARLTVDDDLIPIHSELVRERAGKPFHILQYLFELGMAGRHDFRLCL